MPHRSAEIPAGPDLAERGVYVLPFSGRHGERYVVAINRRRERILEATVYPPNAIQPVVDLMHDYLSREDPEPRRLALLD